MRLPWRLFRWACTITLCATGSLTAGSLAGNFGAPGPGNAYAYGTCSYNDTSTFDGNYGTGSGGDYGYGASAYITAENSSPCSGGGDSTNAIGAWTGVGSAFNTLQNGDLNVCNVHCPFGFAQIGYVKFTSTTNPFRGQTDAYPHPFAEYWFDANGNNKCPSFLSNVCYKNGQPQACWVNGACDDYFKYIDTTDGDDDQTLSNGQQDTYDEYYNSSQDAEVMVLDSVQYSATNFDPLNGITNEHWYGPWGPQWFGEVHDIGDEMPGTSSSRAAFNYVALAPNSGQEYFVTPTSTGEVDKDYNGGQGCQDKTGNGQFYIYHC
jgi:hypothetical protein